MIRLLPFAIPFFLVAYFAFATRWEQGIQSLQQDANRQLDIFSARLFAPSEKYSYLPELVGQYSTIRNAFLHPNKAPQISKTNELLARLNEKAGSNLIYIMSLDGTTIASSNWQARHSLVGSNYSFRPYFQQALQHGSGRFYAMGVTTQVPGYYLSHLVKQNGVPLGVVVVKLDISDLDMQLNKDEHEMMVTDKHGVVFLSSWEEWKYRPIQELESQEAQRLENTRQYEGVLTEALPITHKKTLTMMSA